MNLDLPVIFRGLLEEEHWRSRVFAYRKVSLPVKQDEDLIINRND